MVAHWLRKSTPAPNLSPSLPCWPGRYWIRHIIEMLPEKLGESQMRLQHMAELHYYYFHYFNTYSKKVKHPRWDISVIYSRQIPEVWCGSYHPLQSERLGHP